jgi:hypothetical protein
LRTLFQEVRVSKAFPGDPKNRPIGMTERGDYYTYNPRGLILTLDSASYIAKSNNNGLGRGVVQLEFQDDSRLRGVYSLYIQVDKISGPDY